MDIFAPAHDGTHISQSEALGAATWLWMHSASHRDLPLHALSRLLLPAITRGQFALGTCQGLPVFYVGWASFNADAELRYVRQHPLTICAADWNSGERVWITDLVAPFGHTREVSRWLALQPFARQVVRALYHRGGERGFRIMQFRGRAMPPDQARAWMAVNPVDLGSPGE